MKQTTAKAMSLRAKINNYAKEHGILAQVVLQNYMFECLLDRISRSKYVDNFVIKGGILVSSLVGLDVRSTMDGYKRLFNSENVIPLRSYPLETVLAEKIETIITRGILNTRPRDFYDVYILTKTQGYNAETLRKAIFATSEHRGTKAIMEAETNNRLAVIENSSELQSQWAKYQKKFPYAKDITYQETVNAVKEVIHEIQF